VRTPKSLLASKNTGELLPWSPLPLLLPFEGGLAPTGPLSHQSSFNRVLSPIMRT
jgi:hypothetical protein